jgi:ABC-type multidrug transport system ATPase subunit
MVMAGAQWPSPFHPATGATVSRVVQLEGTMPSNQPIIESHGLGKRYGPVRAVDGLDLRVDRGEVYGFLGPNGAGKTTTLRMLAGLVRPTTGWALVAGHPPGSPQSLARTGWLIETPNFYPYLSGQDNLRVLARSCGLDPRRIGPALDAVELTPRARDRYRTYSLGMKQRLAVAATLLKEPELFVLDEPTNGLDPQGMADMRELIRRLAVGGRTVLLASHLLGEVEQICTRVGVIQRGRLIAEGTVEELRGGAAKLWIRAQPEHRAREVLERVLGADAVTQLDGRFLLRAGGERAAAINRELVLAGVAVSEIRTAERSLEDVFLELTGGEGGL